MLKITPVGDKAESGTYGTYRGVRLLIARMNNTRYKSAFRRLTRPYQEEIDNNQLDDEVSDQLLCEALAEGILIGWDVDTFPGNVKYTKANAIDLLMSDQDCREFVLKFSRDINNFLEREEEGVIKES